MTNIEKNIGDESMTKELIEIHENPNLDEVWDICVRNYLYDQDKYVTEINGLFKKIGITPDSKIADVSAGGGFPAINLIQAGYKVDCFDGFSADVFDNNAKQVGIETRCQSKLWTELPSVVADEVYDFIFCRGNSFIFASGGWDMKKEVDREKAMADYKKTMEIFGRILKKGGYMYIDKFKDSEKGHREKLATINVGGQPQDLLFSSQRYPEKKIRQVFMDRVVGDEILKRENRTTYDLTGDELQKIMEESGFSEVKKIIIASESHFDAWLAKK